MIASADALCLNRPARTDLQIRNQKLIFEAFLNFLQVHSKETLRYDVCLEFGSGRFGYINYYKQYFKKAFALDIYDFKQEYADIDFLLSQDQRSIPLKNNYVDLIVSHSVLEHVVDLETTIKEMDRVLKVGGYALLTVSPLYWSSWGGHLYTKDRVRLNEWEHLDPESEFYLEGTGNEISISLGGILNRMTMSDLLCAVGKVPWEIEKLEIKSDTTKKLPKFLKNFYNKEPVDFHIKEFKLLARKKYVINGDDISPK